tara:strand:- start:1942 stop:2313 length:372 start_codon:yes stop_codon:yes gene_type:complete
MPSYTIKTIIDITRSSPDRADPDQIKQGQQNNFNTLVQGIGMRANTQWPKDPIRTVSNNIAYWHWKFEVEREDTFTKGDDPVGLLKQDLHGIPIIKNLTETETLSKACFMTLNGDQNIWIEES